jgi:hypothetical protein
MPNPLKLVAPAGLLGLAACASVPTGPSVMVLPGTGKNFDQFRVDDAACRQFAYVQAGGKTPTQAATAGSGAATGAGTGEAATSAGTAQERYDIGYIQCMYSKGNRVPVPGNVLYQDRRGSYPPPPPPSGGSSSVPPPPAGTGSSP